MAALSLSIDEIRPLNRWDHARIQPGAVGSVGDVNLAPRLKQSSPDMPLRYDRHFSGKNEVFLGSNVTDGQHINYDSGGAGARTIDSNWGGRRHFKVRHGYIFQDMREPDTSSQPFVAATPQYKWKNQVATVYQAKRTGDQFLPLPGGYLPEPHQVLRGGTFPRTTDVDPGTTSIGSAVVGEAPDQMDLRPRGSAHARLGGKHFSRSYL